MKAIVLGGGVIGTALSVPSGGDDLTAQFRPRRRVGRALEKAKN